jgi:hypothetical protein
MTQLYINEKQSLDAGFRHILYEYMVMILTKTKLEMLLTGILMIY